MTDKEIREQVEALRRITIETVGAGKEACLKLLRDAGIITDKDGASLIKGEREEQLNKHHYSVERDKEIYPDSQLLYLAKYLMSDRLSKERDELSRKIFGREAWQFPPGFQMKLDKKSKIEQLVVAGALIAAEIDRLS
jgi:hypothetical protein